MSIAEFERIKKAAEKLTPKQKTELISLLRGTNGKKKPTSRTNKTKQKLLAEFRQSWKEAMNGEYSSARAFLNELRNND